ncbi:hypothetical protein AFGD_004750 [Aspergillus flavus]|nr:hypothetical protein AFGD_004750 [Aspergillus flavus]
MPWYAVLDAWDDSRHDDRGKDIIEIQADRTEAVRRAFERAERRNYTFDFKDRRGLGGLGGSGNLDEFLVELRQNDRKVEPTVKDMMDIVIPIVERQFRIEDVYLERLCIMGDAGALTWLEELNPMHQLAWSRLIKELEGNEWPGLFGYLKRLVEYLSLASGTSH